MPSPHTTERLIHLDQDYDWTPRQRQVLDFIARGYTNPQIAEMLNVSLDGAKWHVREILSKLGVDTREEAAEYWRAQNGLRVRLSRLFRGVATVGTLRWAGLAGGVVIGAGGMVALIATLSAMGDGRSGGAGPGDEPTAATATSTQPASEPTAGASPSAVATASPAGTAASPVAIGTISTEPLPVVAAAPFPLRLSASIYTWPDHDRESTVVYDTLTGGYRNFGPGMVGTFTPDGTKMAWVADDEVWLVELPDGDPRVLGPGSGLLLFTTNTTVAVSAGGPSRYTEYDLVTGTSRTIEIPSRPVTAADGTELQYIAPGAVQGTWRYAAIPGNGGDAIEFEALSVTLTGSGEAVLATSPQDGRTNVVLVDLATREVTPIAGATSGIGSISIAANNRWIAWTDNYCGDSSQAWGPRGTTKVFDRDTGAVLDLGETFWLAGFTPDGRLGLGDFGARQLVNLDNGEIEVTLPQNGTSDVAWSSDFHYATRGQALGHGGHCP